MKGPSQTSQASLSPEVIQAIMQMMGGQQSSHSMRNPQGHHAPVKTPLAIPDAWKGFITDSATHQLTPQELQAQVQYPSGTGGPPRTVNGNPQLFTPMSSGNPNNALINAPGTHPGDAGVTSLADLQAKYPMLTSPLAANGLQPLQGAPLPGKPSGVPSAINPYYANATTGSGSEYGGYATGAPIQSNVEGFSRYLSPQDIATLQAIPAGLKGDALMKALPASMQGVADPATDPQLNQLSELQQQLQQAATANPNDPYIKQQQILATQAYNSIANGPYWSLLNSGWDPKNFPGIAGGPAAMSKPTLTSKGDYAAQYGYAKTPGPTGNPDFANVSQTLKAAGWDPSKGFGPQTFTPLSGSGLTSYDADMQRELNDLLFSISPRPDNPNLPTRTGAAATRAWNADHGTSPGSGGPRADTIQAQADAQARNDAYVNQTLGGAFYGGVIPPEMHSADAPPDPWETLGQMGFNQNGQWPGQMGAPGMGGPGGLGNWGGIPRIPGPNGESAPDYAGFMAAHPNFMPTQESQLSGFPQQNFQMPQQAPQQGFQMPQQGFQMPQQGGMQGGSPWSFAQNWQPPQGDNQQSWGQGQGFGTSPWNVK